MHLTAVIAKKIQVDICLQRLVKHLRQGYIKYTPLIADCSVHVDGV